MLASSAVRQPPPPACEDIAPSGGVLAADGRRRADPTGAACVLVVEDDVKFADVVARAFARARVSSVLVETGDAALHTARSRGDLDAVVLDVMIPHPDGIEVCHHLRRTCPDLPLIVMSARAGGEQGSRARAAGAAAFLAKPFSLQHLVDVTCDLIELAATTPSEDS